jgi:enediyne biosynthesis protein E3
MRPLAPLLPLVKQDPASVRPVIDGFAVADGWSRQRVVDIVESFLRGYNALAGARRPADAYAELAGVEPFLRPFALEGAAMGYGAWALVNGRRLGGFEQAMKAHSPQTVYQNYVGLGWWLGLVCRGRPGAFMRSVGRLDPVYRLLAIEGAAFRAGFLSGGDRGSLERFRRMPDAAVHVAHQGFGRSLWFSRMGRLDAALHVARALPDRFHGDAVSGLGLACAFSWLDRVAVFQQLLDAVPERLRLDFLQGAAFGWEARRRADRALFEETIAGLPEAQRAAIDDGLAAVDAGRRDLEPAAPPAFYEAWRAETRARLQRLHEPAAFGSRA